MSHINQEFANFPSLCSSRVSNRSSRSRGITVITSQVPKSSTMEKLIEDLPIQQHSFQKFDCLRIDRSDPNHRPKSNFINEFNIFNSDQRSPEEKAKVFESLDSSFMSGSTISKKSVIADTYRIQSHRYLNMLNVQLLNQSLSVHPDEERNNLRKIFMNSQPEQRQYSDLFEALTKPPSQIDGDNYKTPNKRPSPEPISSQSVSSHSPSKMQKPNESEPTSQNQLEKNHGYKKPKDGKYTCACKKDMCLTNYCGCVKNGFKCSQQCNCFTCLNYVGAPPSSIVGRSRKTSVFSPEHYNRVKVTPIKNQRQPNCSISSIFMCLGLEETQSAKNNKMERQKKRSESSEIGCTEFEMELLVFKFPVKINQCYDTEPATSRMKEQ